MIAVGFSLDLLIWIGVLVLLMAVVDGCSRS